MLAGTASDRIRFEQNFKANAEQYRIAGSLSMTDWRNQNNEPLNSGNPLLYFRKRLNNDGTYEILDVRPDSVSGLYYAKFVTLNLNVESPEKHARALEDSLYNGATLSDVEAFYSDFAMDSGIMYLQELLYGYPEEHFQGINYRNETASFYKDCLCSESEVRAFAESLGIDVDFIVPMDIAAHFDAEHNRDLI